MSRNALSICTMTAAYHADQASVSSGSRKTFGSILDQNRGIGRGFDTLRICLSLSIVIYHSFEVALGPASVPMIWGGPAGPACASLLPAFFALSGFLVMGSAVRTPSLAGFIGLRALRIVPALLTEITISALLLGTLLTTVSLRHYFIDPRFFEYFGSLVGRIRTNLPGVFEANPTPGLVNVSLWTVRPELGCYVYLATMMLLGKIKNARVVLFVSCTILTLNLAADLLVEQSSLIMKAVPDQGLLFSFIAGNAAYLYRHKIPYQPIIFVTCLVASYLMLQYSNLSTISVLLLTYCTVWLGLTSLPLIPLMRHGDYSYGIYLYGYPIQQSVAYLLPEFRTPTWNLVLSLPVILALAAVSWHFIEKRALRLRRLLPKSPDVESLATLTWFFLLLTLIAYEAFLNVTVLLQFRHNVSERINLALAVGILLFGCLALLTSRLNTNRRKSAVEIRPARDIDHL